MNPGEIVADTHTQALGLGALHSGIYLVRAAMRPAGWVALTVLAPASPSLDDPLLAPGLGSRARRPPSERAERHLGAVAADSVRSHTEFARRRDAAGSDPGAGLAAATPLGGRPPPRREDRALGGHLLRRLRSVPHSGHGGRIHPHGVPGWHGQHRPLGRPGGDLGDPCTGPHGDPLPVVAARPPRSHRRRGRLR